jgi:DNA mismatch repair protein MutH
MADANFSDTKNFNYSLFFHKLVSLSKLKMANSYLTGCLILTCNQTLMTQVTQPVSLAELLDRATAIAGMTLGELANLHHITIPPDFKKHKGWTGQLIESCLGAAAGSKPEQDFAHLGTELKTIPIDDQGYPLETTYVCYAHLTHIAGMTWENCNLRNKLSRVLWVPVQGMRGIPPAERRVATPFLWEPNQQQLNQLQQDWEELMELIALGHIERVSARQGQLLQLRPKAADGKALTDAVGSKGQPIKTRPRGFYLRKHFTATIIQQAFS